MPSPTEEVSPEISPRIRTVLSKFLTETEISTARIRDVLPIDYDGGIIRFEAGEHQYFLVESDHIETDATYRSIAKANDQEIARKVPMRPEAVPPYPQETPGMEHDFADKRNEWAFVSEDKTSHLLYCLFEVR